MKNEHNLEQLKYIWDNRNLENKAYQYLFHICIEPMKKEIGIVIRFGLIFTAT